MVYGLDNLCDEYVQKKEQEVALQKIQGMSLREVKKMTGISDEYYLKKIISGDLPMSGYFYFKIIPDRPYNDLLRYCIRCGEEKVSIKRLYCQHCSDTRLINKIIKNSSPENSCIKSVPANYHRKSRKLKYGDKMGDEY